MWWLYPSFWRWTARARFAPCGVAHAAAGTGHRAHGLVTLAAAFALVPISLGTTVAPTVIALHPTGAVSSARGTAQLAPASSPFGVAVTRDGHIIYDISVSAEGLGAPGAGRVFVAWAASPNLQDVRRIGALDGAGATRGQVDLNKFMVIVTVEPAPNAPRWTGTALLKGVSPSSLLQSFVGHGLFEVPGE